LRGAFTGKVTKPKERGHIMHWIFIIVAALLFLGAGCLGLAESHNSSIDVAGTKRFYIYADAGFAGNHGEWTNYMPENAGTMITLNLVDKTDPVSGSSAIHADVKLPPPGWCGIAVAVCPDCWGLKPQAAYDLSKATKLVFNAKGNGMIQVKIAIAGDKPYGDSAKISLASEWIMLKPTWEEHEIDLQNYQRELKRVITPFVFVTNKQYNPLGAVTVYLDEIYFVME
jgi:hypothetical protein